MDTEGRITTGEIEDDPADAGQDAVDPGDAAPSGGRPVRVSYEPRRFGVALVVDEEGTGGADDTAGLLRVGAAVVTLEIPTPGGGRSVLTWDPAEVAVNPLSG